MRAIFVVSGKHFAKHRLQLRLMRAMERARLNGWCSVISDTTDNMHSANNFIRAGYRPPTRWLPQRASTRRPSWRWLRRPVLLNPSLSAGPAAQLPEPASAPRATSAPAPSAKAGLPDEKPSANDAKRKVGAALTATAIAAIIVQASRAQYHAGGRPCACPDDTMRNGRACGGRSAYSRPGGASPGRQRAA